MVIYNIVNQELVKLQFLHFLAKLSELRYFLQFLSQNLLYDC